MSEIIMRRVEDDKYQLEIGGDVYKSYNQTKMRHPGDWIGDVDDIEHNIMGLHGWTYQDARDL